MMKMRPRYSVPGLANNLLLNESQTRVGRGMRMFEESQWPTRRRASGGIDFLLTPAPRELKGSSRFDLGSSKDFASRNCD